MKKEKKARTARDERRRGVWALIVSAVLFGGGLTLWWLVTVTNREGNRGSPELFTLFTLIPLANAVEHFVRAWYLDRREPPSDVADRGEDERRAA